MNKNVLRYLVIPAAGLGSRMKTVHPALPKEMLPVGRFPAIHYAVMEGLSAGIVNIIIIINKCKEIIRHYFEGDAFRKNLHLSPHQELKYFYKKCSISFLYQEKPLGEADAISLAEDMVGTDPFAVVYPDNIYFPAPGSVRILSSTYFRYRKEVAGLMAVTDDNSTGISNSGRVDIQEMSKGVFRIRKVIPKGEGKFVSRFPVELRTCGLSASAPGFFEKLREARETVKSGEFMDIHVRRLIADRDGLIGCLLPGTVFDIGNPEGYRLCQDFVIKTK